MRERAARGVIFDMDGTLIEPAIDFKAMRRAIGVPTGDVLEVIASWGDEARAAEALATIASFEREAALKMALMPGVTELLAWLSERPLQRAIVTRNNHHTLQLAVDMMKLDFSPLIDRSFSPPKPAPDALLRIATDWGMAPEEVWMIGDSRHDLHAAQAAGMRCCLVAQHYNRDYLHEAHAVVERLDELIAVLV